MEEKNVLSRKERDRRLREDDILRAAERVFATEGYHKATISDIAREAQYAVGTIYLYFKDKQTLYLTLIEKKFQDMFSVVKSRVGQVEDAGEKIKALIEEQLAYFERNQDFFRIYFSERGGLRWKIKGRISKSAIDRLMDFIDFIAGLINKAQEKRIIRDDIEPKKLAHILASMLNAVIFPLWLREAQGKADLRSMSGLVLDMFLNGAGRK